MPTTKKAAVTIPAAVDTNPDAAIFPLPALADLTIPQENAPIPDSDVAKIKTAFDAIYTKLPAAIQADRNMQMLIKIEEWDLALDRANELAAKHATPMVDTGSVLDPRIAWTLIEKTFDPHAAALKQMGIAAESPAGIVALHMVGAARDNIVNQDKGFCDALIEKGHDRDTVKRVMLDQRTMATTMAKNLTTAMTLNGIMTDHRYKAICEAHAARMERDAELQRVNAAYLLEIEPLLTVLDPIAMTMGIPRESFPDMIHLTGDGQIVTLPLTRVGKYASATHLFGMRSNEGKILVYATFADLVDAIAQKRGLKIAHCDNVAFAGNRTSVTESGITLKGKGVDGLKFLQHGFVISQGGYTGAYIAEAAVKGAGNPAYIKVGTHEKNRGYDTEVDSRLAELKNALEAESVSILHFDGASIKTCGATDLASALIAAVKGDRN